MEMDVSQIYSEKRVIKFIYLEIFYVQIIIRVILKYCLYFNLIFIKFYGSI